MIAHSCSFGVLYSIHMDSVNPNAWSRTPTNRNGARVLGDRGSKMCTPAGADIHAACARHALSTLIDWFFAVVVSMGNSAPKQTAQSTHADLNSAPVRAAMATSGCAKVPPCRV